MLRFVGTATDEAREPPAGTQLTQKIARIEELVLQVERAEKNTEHVQKQLNDTLKKLKVSPQHHHSRLIRGSAADDHHTIDSCPSA